MNFISRSSIQRIHDRYDPENDAHKVTWAENELVYVIQDLDDHITKLNQTCIELRTENEELKRRVARLADDLGRHQYHGHD